MDTEIDVRAFSELGYTVARGLLTGREVEELLAQFMAFPQRGAIPGHFDPVPQNPGTQRDPLCVYPRVMNPHLISETAVRHLLDPRIGAIVARLLGEEPIAAQSMFYFKPPGARGQALHQDNFYLRVEPGTCIAAWAALDRADRGNGGLEVVPGTHRMDLFCPQESDADRYFTKEYVPLPPGLEQMPVDLAPGDVLFFNGSLVHGSEPNRSADRFRRSFICHYAPRSAQRIAEYYQTFTMDGAALELAASEGGGPCGTEFADAGSH